ncbi:MAG TPA: hypothetical protein GXX29_13215 [Firmicutes bacterium]|nr:hypothetical protein [Bacillota bacterium]
MKATEVIDKLKEMVGSFNHEEYFCYGDLQMTVTGVLVCWKARLDAIKAAQEKNCNLIICHEDLFYPYVISDPHRERYLSWKVNRQRVDALAKGEVTVFRAHASLDRLCIYGTFARLWGLDCPVKVEHFSHVFDMQPTTVEELAERGKATFGVGEVRVCGDPKRVVSKAGLPWGGLGLALNIKYVHQMVDMGADVLLCGECDEYVMHAAYDLDIPIIETSHVVSETPGLRVFTEMFAAACPGIPVHFHEQLRPWQVR